MPPLPHVGHFRSNPQAGLELKHQIGTFARDLVGQCPLQAIAKARKAAPQLDLAAGGIAQLNDGRKYPQNTPTKATASSEHIRTHTAPSGLTW